METINFPTYHVLQKVKVIYTTSGIISSPDCTDELKLFRKYLLSLGLQVSNIFKKLVGLENHLSQGSRRHILMSKRFISKHVYICIFCFGGFFIKKIYWWLLLYIVLNFCIHIKET